MTLDGFSMQRGKILSILQHKPLTIAEIIKETKIPRSTLYHHLEVLKRKKLIKENKDKDKTGQPVIISITNLADPVPLAMIEAYEKFLKLFQR